MVWVDYFIMHNYEWTHTDKFDNFSNYIFKIKTLSLSPNYPGSLAKRARIHSHQLIF